ncbi:MAG: insulinase family protein [Bacteroidales bacterium]|nr:insulinase family protein [Bacteroidales bacterium]
MIKKTFLFLAGFLFFIFSAKAQDLSDTLKPDTSVRIGKLANGLTYYIKQNKEPKDRVSLRLVVNTGSICETKDQQGLAHLIEHMCFNGTKHFKKQALVDFIEASGVKFGAHLNASTSFDETIYKLQMPTDRESLLDSAMLVLEDWAHNVSLEGSEIDKERGVVKEEWRLGLGAQDRMQKKYIPVILKGSRYAERLPIGKMAVIDTAHYETLRNFYHTWYRPDLMAVIVVGDINLNQMQKLIEKHFGKLENPKDEEKRIVYGVPGNIKPLIAIESDSEATSSQVVIFYKHPRLDDPTVRGFRNSLRDQLFDAMISSRLNEIAQNPNAPFIYAGAGYGSFIGRTDNAYVTFAIAKDNKILNSLKILLDEDARVKDFGFTETELQRQKENILRRYEQMEKEKDKQSSNVFVQDYINNFLTHEPIPSIDEEYNLARQLIPTVTLKEENALSHKWVTDSNMVVMALQPQKKGIVIPTEQQIMAVIDSSKTVVLKPYVDKVNTAPLIDHEITPGKIVSMQNVGGLYQKWVLSNGIEVFLKKTDFKNDQILYKAYSLGGSSLLPDDQMMTSRILSDVIEESGLGQFSNVELDKKLSGKVLSLSPYIHTLSQGFTGNASPKDLETLFKLQYLYFTQPRKDRSIFEKVIEDQKTQVKHLGDSPRMVFYDSVYRVATLRSPRVIIIPKIDQLNSIWQSEIYRIYRTQFQNSAGYKVFLVGNIDTANLKPLVEKYLASLPVTEPPLKWKDVSLGFPGGKTNVVVHKGSEPQSMVMMMMKGKYEYNFDNNLLMDALTQALDIELREVVREQESGTYGIYISPSTELYPEQKYSLTLGFGCAPDNVDHLVKSVFNVFEKFQKEGPDALTLKKVKETFIRTRQSDVRENSFWMNQIVNSQFEGTPIKTQSEYDAAVNSITIARVKKAAKKYLTMDHYVLGVLKPQK